MGACASTNAGRRSAGAPGVADTVVARELPLPAGSFADDHPPVGGEPRHFGDISRTSSFEMRTRWSRYDEERMPEEYAHAAAMICVMPAWMSGTRTLRYLQEMESRLRADKALRRRMSDARTFNTVVRSVVRKAYDLPDARAASEQRDLIHDCLIVDRVEQLHAHMVARQAHLTYALTLIDELDDPEALPAKLSEICDRAGRCASAKRQAFNLLVQRSYHLLEQSSRSNSNAPSSDSSSARSLSPDSRGASLGGARGSSGAAGAARSPSIDRSSSISAPPNLGTRDGAMAHVRACFEDYLDEHKERAVSSAYVEPARFYFDLVGDTFGRDHVAVHSVNWFLAVLSAALGIQAPLLLDYDDRHALGIVDVWQALNDDAWALFSHPTNFGREFEGVRYLRERGALLLKTPVPSGQLPCGTRTTLPKQLANMAVHPSSPARLRRELALYCERFAHFFRAEFFARKAFEVLWAELKPERVGFRRASDTLYAAYRAETGAEEEELVEHVYADEYYTELDVSRVVAFFAWAGLLKPDAASQLELHAPAADASLLPVDSRSPFAAAAAADGDVDETGSQPGDEAGGTARSGAHAPHERAARSPQPSSRSEPVAQRAAAVHIQAHARRRLATRSAEQLRAGGESTPT